MTTQQDFYCEHGIPLFAVTSCTECKAKITEVERLRRENEQLRQENQRLRGQLSTSRTWPDQA